MKTLHVFIISALLSLSCMGCGQQRVVTQQAANSQTVTIEYCNG